MILGIIKAVAISLVHFDLASLSWYFEFLTSYNHPTILKFFVVDLFFSTLSDFHSSVYFTTLLASLAIAAIFSLF